MKTLYDRICLVRELRSYDHRIAIVVESVTIRDTYKEVFRDTVVKISNVTSGSVYWATNDSTLDFMYCL